MKNTVIVFDLDGTLIQSETLIISIMNKVLTTHGFSVQVEACDIGPPLPEMLKKLTGQPIEQLMDCMDAFKAEYDLNAHLSPLYLGAGSIFNKLSDYNCWIATNKRRYPTEKIMREHGWSHWLKDQCFCGDDEGGISKKEMLFRIKNKTLQQGATHWIMVGDTQSDYDAAVAAQFDRFMWAHWGVSDHLEPSDLNIDKPSSLVEFIQWMKPDLSEANRQA